MKKLLVVYIVLAALIIALAFVFSSCSSHKEIATSSSHTDSTAIEYWKNKFEQEHQFRLQAEQELRQSEYSAVEFDSTRCPQLPHIELPEDCNSDSLRKVISKLNSTIDQLNNAMAGLNKKVKFYADGSFEAEGNIKSANKSKEQMQRQYLALLLQYNSLVASDIGKSVAVQKDTITRQVSKKRSFPWWLLLLAFAAGTYAQYRFKWVGNIISFLRF